MHYLDSDFGYEDFDGYIEENKWALTLVLVRHAYQMWAFNNKALAAIVSLCTELGMEYW